MLACSAYGSINAYTYTQSWETQSHQPTLRARPGDGQVLSGACPVGVQQQQSARWGLLALLVRVGCRWLCFVIRGTLLFFALLGFRVSVLWAGLEMVKKRSEYRMSGSVGCMSWGLRIGIGIDIETVLGREVGV